MIQLRLELWARSRPPLGSSILERYPDSLALLRWDEHLAAVDEKSEAAFKANFDLPAPENPYTGRTLGEVPLNKPAAGEFSYLPLKGRATLPDGSSVDGVFGYALFLWGGRRLNKDAVISGAGFAAPVAMTLQWGLDKRTYPPGMVFPDEVQSIDEGLAERGLTLIRRH